jgi:hypothetical protein
MRQPEMNKKAPGPALTVHGREQALDVNTKAPSLRRSTNSRKR